MQTYPFLTSSTNDKITQTVRRIIELRLQDVSEFNNLNQKFLAGRKVGKIPVDSNDIEPTDRELDWNYDDSYVYWALVISGDLKWRRIAHGSF